MDKYSRDVGRVVVKKDGSVWDFSPFDPGNTESMGVAMVDALNWRSKILTEEPEAKVRILVRPPRNPPARYGSPFKL